MTGCVAGWKPCSRPVVAVLTAGCVHEHMRIGPICQHHLDKSGHGLICRACVDHPAQPHRGCVVHELQVEMAS